MGFNGFTKINQLYRHKNAYFSELTDIFKEKVEMVIDSNVVVKKYLYDNIWF